MTYKAYIYIHSLLCLSYYIYLPDIQYAYSMAYCCHNIYIYTYHINVGSNFCHSFHRVKVKPTKVPCREILAETLKDTVQRVPWDAKPADDGVTFNDDLVYPVLLGIYRDYNL